MGDNFFENDDFGNNDDVGREDHPVEPQHPQQHQPQHEVSHQIERLPAQLALRRLLHRMERYEDLSVLQDPALSPAAAATAAVANTHDAEEAEEEKDDDWEITNHSHAHNPTAGAGQSWHSLLVRSRMCQDLWQEVAAQNVQEGSNPRLRKEYLELSRRVDAACQRAEFLADRAREQDVQSGRETDLVGRLFLSRQTNEGDGEGGADGEEDLPAGSTDGDGGDASVEEDEDYFDEFDSDNDSEAETVNRKNQQKDRHTPIDETTSTEELQKAQREQMEKAIAMMARQMKESTMGIQNKLQQQTASTLDELETVAEQNMADVTEVAQNVKDHVSARQKSAWASWTTLIVIAGVFVFSLLTIFTVPKSPDASLSKVFSAEGPYARLANKAVGGIRSLFDGDDWGDDEEEEEHPLEEEEEDTYDYHEDEASREAQRLEKERLEELVRDMRRGRGRQNPSTQTQQPPPPDNEKEVETIEEELNDETDNGEETSEEESEEHEIDDDVDETDYYGERHNYDDDDDDDEIREARENEYGEYYDDDDEEEEEERVDYIENQDGEDGYSEEEEEIEENNEHEGDVDAYDEEEGTDENFTAEGSYKKEGDDEAEKKEDFDNPWGIAPEEDIVQDEKDFSRRRQRRERLKKNDDGQEPEISQEIDVNDIMASLQEQQQALSDDPILEESSEPVESPSTSDNQHFDPTHAFEREGMAKERISPRDFRVAAASGNYETMERYLEIAPEHINRQDKYGWTALHLAVNNNHDRIVSLLLEQNYAGDDDGMEDLIIDPYVASYEEEKTAFDLALEEYGTNHPVTNTFFDMGVYDRTEIENELERERKRVAEEEEARRREQSVREHNARVAKEQEAWKIKEARLAAAEEEERRLKNEKLEKLFGAQAQDEDEEAEGEESIEDRRSRLDALLDEL